MNKFDELGCEHPIFNKHNFKVERFEDMPQYDYTYKDLKNGVRLSYCINEGFAVSSLMNKPVFINIENESDFEEFIEMLTMTRFKMLVFNIKDFVNRKIERIKYKFFGVDSLPF